MITVTDPDKGTVTGVTDPKGQTVSYQYDAQRRKTKTSTTLDGKEVRTEYGYDAQTGYLSGVKHNTRTETSGDVIYRFGYDSLGRQVSTQVGNRTLSTTDYDPVTRQIQKVAYGNGDEVRYSYDAYGRLTGVSFDEEESARFTYAYDATGRVGMVQDAEQGTAVYSDCDLQGRPAIVEWNNGTTTASYAYVYNLQGDVIALTDSIGVKVVGYTYDAWGKPLSTTGSLRTTLGKLNPFLYRGYVYDDEIDFYYLKSRYYNANRGRFINADTVFDGANFFRYCKNNPEMNVDTSGGETDCFSAIYNADGDFVPLIPGNSINPNIKPYEIPNDSLIEVLDPNSDANYFKVRYNTGLQYIEGYMHRKYIDVTYFPQSIRRTFREDTIIAKIGEEYNDDVAFSSITINIKHYLNRYYLYRYGIRHYLNTNEKRDRQLREAILDFQMFYHDNVDESFVVDGYLGIKTCEALYNYVINEMGGRG